MRNARIVWRGVENRKNPERQRGIPIPLHKFRLNGIFASAQDAFQSRARIFGEVIEI